MSTGGILRDDQQENSQVPFRCPQLVEIIPWKVRSHLLLAGGRVMFVGGGVLDATFTRAPLAMLMSTLGTTAQNEGSGAVMLVSCLRVAREEE